MKTLFSLLFAALVVNACVRAGDSAWRYYQLEDAVEQEARFSNLKTATALRTRIIQIAGDRDVDLTDEDVVVEGRGQETYVSLVYIEPVPLVPSLYTYQQTYDITVTVQTVRPIVNDIK